MDDYEFDPDQFDPDQFVDEYDETHGIYNLKPNSIREAHRYNNLLPVGYEEQDAN